MKGYSDTARRAAAAICQDIEEDSIPGLKFTGLDTLTAVQPHIARIIQEEMDAAGQTYINYTVPQQYGDSAGFQNRVELATSLIVRASTRPPLGPGA